MTWEDDLIADLERIGEREAKTRLIRTEFGNVGSPRYLVVDAWLRSKEDARKSEADSRRESREEMNLSISRKALRNARWATIIAIIATIIAASDNVILFLRWLGILTP